MIVTLATLRAAGLTEAQIMRVVEAVDNERVAAKREQNRKASQKHRAHQKNRADAADAADASLSLVSKKETLSKERKGVRGKPTLIPLPNDWQPKGPQRDPTEAEEFRDKARAKAWMYANWDAAYRNFQKSEYNARNKNGGVQHVGTDERRREMMLKMHAQGASPYEIEEAIRKDTGLGQEGTGVDPKFRSANGVARSGDQKMGH